jgi:D-tagatose-1,6-bisphosphate aldolase subunit GatZ/KbaZ
MNPNPPTLPTQKYFDSLLHAQKQGQAVGISSICSSNPFVIQASFHHALHNDQPVLIESTCNQVNQFGGYAGMTPADFVHSISQAASQAGFAQDRLILGGDHLGPYPWQNEPVQQAMDKARRMVQDYVLAGYTKLHLDASMVCGGDDPARPLETRIAAQRTAELALEAETAWRALDQGAPLLCYVIGTEVPTPGGIQVKVGHLAVSVVDHVQETIEVTHQAFQQKGLEAAWQRVIAVVVHPGVEFGNEIIYPYNPQLTVRLSRFIETCGPLVYEAHSTDYQTSQALKQMVTDHFAILKVGPALTFALREALFALAMAEEELLAGRARPELSRLRQTLEETMVEQPVYWEKYYPGDPAAQHFARAYSFSDRIRYYWPVPRVQQAVSKLLENLEHNPLPLSLVSQYFPQQYTRVRDSSLPNTPLALVLDKIEEVLRDYTYACGG